MAETAPRIKRPTAGQAVAITCGAALFAMFSCGGFLAALDSRSDFAGTLILGAAGAFFAGVFFFFYGIVKFVRRLRGK